MTGGRARYLYLAALLAFLVAAPAGLRGGPAGSPRPDVVLILTDDQRWDTLPYMPILRQSIGAPGVVFTNAFVTTPLCCPSRASLLTGQYAHHTRVMSNRPPLGGAEKFVDRSTLATWLRSAGYRTGLFGKYLNGYRNISPRVPPGWEEWAAFVATGYLNYSLNESGTIHRYGATPEDYSTEVLARKAAAFLQRTPVETPAFVYYTPFAPHRDAVPAPRDATAFSDLPPWRPPSYNEADVSDKPTFVRRQRQWDAARQAQVDAIRRQQLGTLLAVDRAVGMLVETQRARGRLAQTVWIFQSDNGFAWGEHRWARKGCPYEECVRVPLVIAAPGIAPRQDAHLVLNIDIAPTLAEFAGLPVPAPVDGMSLVPLLRNPATEWRRDFLLEFFGDEREEEGTEDSEERAGGAQQRAFVAVRTDRWIYVEYARTGERELYDLQTDPFELQNVSGDPSRAPLITQLKAQMEALRARPPAMPGSSPTPRPTTGP